MKKDDFDRQINSLVPQPDPNITADLFEFGQEMGNEFDRDVVQDLLNSLSFISRHFNAETAQRAYELIQYDGVLPDEMVAAAFHLQSGTSPQDVSRLAKEGQFMCFHWPGNVDELSPLALCTVTEDGQNRSFHTLHFGAFDPDAALRSAQRYACDRQISVTDALLSLTTNMELNSKGGARKILVSNDPDMTQTLSAAFGQCAAVSARLTFDADHGQAAVEYNPLWLELRQQQEQVQSRIAQSM